MEWQTVFYGNISTLSNFLGCVMYMLNLQIYIKRWTLFTFAYKPLVWYFTFFVIHTLSVSMKS